MNKAIKNEILHNLEVRKDLKSLFDRFKKGSNKSLTSIDAALMEIKFSSIVDGSIDDIWCYLFYLNHVGYLSLDEVSHLIDPLKKAESDLYADSEGLDEMIEEVRGKIDPNNVEDSVSKLEKPKDIYERYILQRALFQFDYIVDLD